MGRGYYARISSHFVNRRYALTHRSTGTNRIPGPVQIRANMARSLLMDTINSSLSMAKISQGSMVRRADTALVRIAIGKRLSSILGQVLES
jgi:hypothetical protein